MSTSGRPKGLWHKHHRADETDWPFAEYDQESAARRGVGLQGTG